MEAKQHQLTVHIDSLVKQQSVKVSKVQKYVERLIKFGKKGYFMQEMQSRKRVETELRNAVEQLQNKCGVYESLLNKDEAK